MDNKLIEYVLKHSKNRDKELKYDFMPSLLEIIERPAHKMGTVIIVGVFTLLVATIIWACLSEIDVVVTSNGTIQPIGDLNVVQSYLGGTVTKINTSEGSYVKTGDVLIELDAESLDIDANQLNNQKAILEIQKKIYMMIKNNEDLSAIDITVYDDEVQPYIQNIIESDISHINALGNLEKEKVNADLNRQIAQIQLEQYQSEKNESKIKIQELMIQQYTLTIEKLDLQISDNKTQYNIQINSQISQIESELNQVNAELDKYYLSKKHQYITAPVSGYVNSININTIGEVVTSSQELITIVPENAKSEMVCYVKNMDIADVKLDMKVEVKLDAYSYNKYGTVKGTVKYISPSAFSNEYLGNVYLVKIDIIEIPNKIDIIPGLSGTVEIKTDNRTVMEYFLDPIIKGFGKSLKEK